MLLLSSILWAHVPKPCRFFKTFVQTTDETKRKVEQSVFEKRDNNTDSPVILVHGADQFNKFVLLASHQQPVVVKLFSLQNPESLRIKPIFHKVADFFKKEVFFAALDVVENHEILNQIMLFYKLKSVDLPLFLFYKDGGLYAPAHAPAAMVQGYLNEENLKNFIKEKFFVSNTSGAE
jgi:thioredoxin-like negative regulator of GroEL